MTGFTTPLFNCNFRSFGNDYNGENGLCYLFFVPFSPLLNLHEVMVQKY